MYEEKLHVLERKCDFFGDYEYFIFVYIFGSNATIFVQSHRSKEQEVKEVIFCAVPSEVRYLKQPIAL